VPTVDLGYRPRDQFIPFHERRERWACLVAHRRAGKTVACVADLIDAALRCDKPSPRFAYIAPLFVQAKDVAWGYVKRMTRDIPGTAFNEAELRVDLPGDRRIRLYGADNYDRLRGIYLDGVILDEYADMPPAAWGAVIRPALADRQGWAVFIGTPKGRNAFWDVYERSKADSDWYSAVLRASETGLLAQSELDAARAEMTPEQYQGEFECSFDAAILGSFYGKELADLDKQGRIADVPYDPAVSVYTAWDLGIGDATAIWFFQVVGPELHVIDHYEAHGHGLQHYAAVLQSKPYKYAKHYVPHDAMARDLGTGRTRVETLKELTGAFPNVLRQNDVMDGINALRVSMPRSRWDAVRCREGIEALRQYRTEYDEKLKTFKDRPRHDWTSHTADAARYMAMAWRELRADPVAPKPVYDFIAKQDGSITSGLTFSEIIKRKERSRQAED
jgi:phage terminase large subunit